MVVQDHTEEVSMAAVHAILSGVVEALNYHVAQVGAVDGFEHALFGKDHVKIQGAGYDQSF